MSARWAVVEAVYLVAAHVLGVAAVALLVLGYMTEHGYWGIPAGFAIAFAGSAYYKSYQAARYGKGDV